MASADSSLTPGDLARIASRAAVLWERAALFCPDSAAPDVSSVPATRVEKRLRDWIAAAAEGDQQAFSERLAAAGYDVAAARRLLAAEPPIIISKAWTAVLTDILAADVPPSDLDLADVRQSEFPFEPVFAPFIAVACRHVADASDGQWARLAAPARCGLQHALLDRLSELAARTLLVEFRAFVAAADVPLGQTHASQDAPPATGNDGRRHYRRFVGSFADQGWRSIFLEYPVLARLMATALLQWVEVVAEFLERFEADRTEIGRIFFPGATFGELHDVRANLSDAHAGGRTVMLLTFATGRRLIYKPKSLALEAAYAALAEWLNLQGGHLTFRCPVVLDRGNYGWVEFIDHVPCTSEDEVTRFYHRLGAFICLVYVLNGIDFHFENLIACGAYPVPVDLETIYHPVSPPSNSELDDPVARRLRQSVLRTHILPNPIRLHDGYCDISVVARTPDDARPFEGLKWVGLNTDAMQLARGPVPPPIAANTPRLPGRDIEPEVYVSDIVGGFQEMYLLMQRQKPAMLAGDNPFCRLFDVPARFLFRATSFYQSLLNKLLNPDQLRDGIDFGIQLDTLARRLLKSGATASHWQLARAEADALTQCDIPKFSARGTATSVILPTGVEVHDCLTTSARQTAEQRLRNLCDADLAWQTSVIKGAMDAHAMRRLAAQEPPPAPCAAPDEAAPLIDRVGLLACAARLAREIEAAAIWSDDGEPGWLALNYLPGANQFALQGTSLDLYNGRSGIGLFFAALARCQPELGYRRIAYSTLAPVRRWLAKAGPGDVATMGIGGLVGIPSLLYALVRAGNYLGDQEMVAEARRAAALLDHATIAADRKYDVTGGAAGAVLCLLACWQATAAPELLDKAAECGRHLLTHREIDKSGARVWPTFAGKHLSGVSHGSSGIAYALLRLGLATGERGFSDAGREAIEFDNAEFVPAAHNWPDRRPWQDDGRTGIAAPTFKVAWCNGAPGIGLARLFGLAALDTPAIRRDIEAALHCCQSTLLERDHICCGNLGLAETLLAAGHFLSAPQWTAAALRVASRVAAMAERHGGFAVRSDNGFFIPTLFQGAAGVGYEFLRLADPDSVASVLALE